MSYSITALFAALFALLYLYLTYAEGKVRKRARTDITPESQAAVEDVSRGKAAFAETTPLTLIILLLLEQLALASWMLYLFGGLMLLARLLHSIGLGSGGIAPARFLSRLLTLLTLLGGAIQLLMHVFGQ
ncbi:MAG: hypothetical protein Tsb002_25480 [Wenzhouxiangellaceae bacterium]